MHDNVKKYATKYRPTLNTLLAVGFSVLALFATALLVSGYKFNKGFYKDWDFWIETGVRYIVTMSVYLIVKRAQILTGKFDDLKPYKSAKERYDTKVAQVRRENKEEEIELAVNLENERRRREKCQALLDAVTHNLSIDELDNLTEADIDAHIKRYMLTKKEGRKLRKAIKNALNSKVDYEHIRVSDVLVYQESNLSKDAQIVINTKAMAARDNARKSIMFIGIAFITAMLSWKGLSPEFWSIVLEQATLIVSSIIGAIFAATSWLEELAAILDNRSGLINEALAKSPGST